MKRIGLALAMLIATIASLSLVACSLDALMSPPLSPTVSIGPSTPTPSPTGQPNINSDTPAPGITDFAPTDTTTLVGTYESVTQASTSSPEGLLQFTQTTVEPNCGYVFDYPTEWFVARDDRTSEIVLSSYPPGTPEPVYGQIPDGAAKITFDIFAKPGQGFPTLQDFVDYMKLPLAGSQRTVLAEKSFTLPSGLDSVYLQTKTEAPANGKSAAIERISSAYYVVVNGCDLVIAGYGDLNNFNAIVNTLRLNPTP